MFCSSWISSPRTLLGTSINICQTNDETKGKKHSQESPETRGFCFVFLSLQACSNLSPLTYLAQRPLWLPSHISPGLFRGIIKRLEWSDWLSSPSLPLSFFLSLLPSSPPSLSLCATYVFNIFNEWVIVLKTHFMFFICQTGVIWRLSWPRANAMKHLPCVLSHAQILCRESITHALVYIQEGRGFPLAANSLKILSTWNRIYLLLMIHVQNQLAGSIYWVSESQTNGVFWIVAGPSGHPLQSKGRERWRTHASS